MLKLFAQNLLETTNKSYMLGNMVLLPFEGFFKAESIF